MSNQNSDKDKILGPSKYSNSKKKKQKKTIKKDPRISKQNHDLKVKIKNLQKEINRILQINKNDSNIVFLEKKLEKLEKLKKSFDQNNIN